MLLNYEGFRNLAELFDQLELVRGSMPAVRILTEAGDSYEEISSPVFFQDIKACAAYYQEKSLPSGHIGLMGISRYEWLVNQYALWTLGNVTVLFGDTFTGEEIVSGVLQTDVKLYLADEVCLESAKSGLAEHPEIPVWPMWKPVHQEAEGITASFASFAPEVQAEDPAVIIFTSGTTGDKKAVVLSHRAIMAGVCNNIVGTAFESQMVILPFHHLAGFNPVLNTLCLNGIVDLCGEFKNLFQGLAVMKPDYMFAVPAILKILVKRLKKGGKHGEKIGWNLKAINSGGAKFTPEVLDTFMDADIKVMQAYGASELGGIGFTCELSFNHPDTIGACNEHLEAKLVDGELMVRSASIMTGYYKDTKQTEEVIHDGWYATGDLAHIDENGYYYITGRKKNLIILSNGENISPEEIEKKLSAIPEVAEVMVYEEKDLLSAVILPNEDREELRNSIQEQIGLYNKEVPTYKRLAGIYFRKTPLLKNPMMKLIRTQDPFKEQE